MKTTLLKPALFLMAVGIWPAVGTAGPVFFPGRLDGNAFTPAKNAAAACYSIRSSTIKAEITNGLATVRLLEEVTGPAESLETVCIIPLPADVSAGTAAVVRIGPDGKESPVEGVQFLPAAEARRLYESVSAAIGRPQLLALGGRPALVAPSFALKDEVSLAVTFRLAAEGRDGLQSISLPTPVTHCARGGVGRLTAEVTLSEKNPLRTIFSPSHDVKVTRDGLTRAVVRSKCEDWSGNEDLRLFWVADTDELGLRVLASRPDKGEDGFFMLFGNPTGSATAEKAAPREILFILDTSGSMRGEKIEQARAAMEYCLERLNPDDRFNIITFGTKVTPFQASPVAASAERVTAARAFMEEAVAEGGTNISGALAAALVGEATPGRPRLAIFLTDGAPTAGEMIPNKIIEAVKTQNRSGTQVFVFGVGDDVNAHLLDKLAEETEGSSEYVRRGEAIDDKVAVLYDRLANPFLTCVALDCGDLQTTAVYPKKLPTLFRGSEVMLLGRYRNGGKHTFTVSGLRVGQAFSYTCTAELPGEAEDAAGREFLPPLWAARTIGFLLQEIRLHGRNDELIAEVVRLSRRYGIATEYTGFIATAGREIEEMDDKELAGEVKKRMEAANDIQSGSWAVNQAFNDRQMQTKLNASPSANTYVGRRGEVVKADTIRHIGGQAFYLREGQWVAAAEAGSRKVRAVALNSPEYLDLVRTSREFAQAQQLGWSVAMNVGEERIVVEKDGQQQDEELKKLAPPPEAEPEVDRQEFNQQLNPFNEMPNMKNIQKLNLRRNGAAEE